MKSKQPKKVRASRSGGRIEPARLGPKTKGTQKKGSPTGAKLAEGTVCGGCGVSYRRGRYVWKPRAAVKARVLCPACVAIRDGNPGGRLELSGDFLAEHRDELLGLVKHVAEREGAEHALSRIMAIEPGDGVVAVTTTEAHLAHSIGKALYDAYRGELSAPFEERDEMARIRWRR